MPEPITMAIAAFGAIKTAVGAGKSIAELGKDIGTLFDAIDDCRNAHTKKKDSVFTGSANEQALDTFVKLQEAKDLENNLREIIIATRGFNAWQELIALRSQIRRERKEQQEALERQQEERFDAIVMYSIIGVVLLIFLGLGTLILLGMTGRI